MTPYPRGGCTFCERPITARLTDRFTGTVVEVCETHEIRLAKLKGFADPEKIAEIEDLLYEWNRSRYAWPEQSH
jgi:hypothetical protein